jgi:hypothetical protein
MGHVDRIDQTIVPWAALWLFYFEEWLSSDQWKGGGEHPGEPKVAGSTRPSTRGLATGTPTVIDSASDPIGAAT